MAHQFGWRLDFHYQCPTGAAIGTAVYGEFYNTTLTVYSYYKTKIWRLRGIHV